MPTPFCRSGRSAAKSRSTSSAGRLAVGSSSTRKSQSTASARAMATSDFSVRVRSATRVCGSKSQSTRLSARRAIASAARQSISPRRRSKPWASAMFSAMVIHSIRPRSW